MAVYKFLNRNVQRVLYPSIFLPLFTVSSSRKHIYEGIFIEILKGLNTIAIFVLSTRVRIITNDKIKRRRTCAYI